MNIHPTAIVDPKAELGKNISIGPYTIINEGVRIGDNVQIGSNVLIDSGAIIGRNCKIHHGAVLGTPPQDLKFGGEKTILEIGENTVIREYATINRGTRHRGKVTVGSNCFIMMYAHIAHDCIIGNNVILANSVNLAGHVEVEDYAIIGGVVPVHQFTRIGAHSIIGGGFRVPKDVPPYILAGGYPLRYIGLNIIGLKRRNFSADTILALKKACRILFQSQYNTTQAVEKIKSEIEPLPEIKHLLEFIEKSERGIIK
ncbi:MAG: acyl-ACP--UDP-N-acetylglucosamine O-acyltransferase [candidate division Zixibacteria bacterium]|nr:acyl-ACP--UDP-N-acetylglucosamine O-acyltransferase [candidate division Zixibacteria bacterium]